MSRREVVLDVAGLTVGYEQDDGSIAVVVEDLSLRLRAGEILGLAGESGCGKSTAALAAIGFRGPGTRVLAGESKLGETDLLTVSRADLRSLWGRRLAYVAQDAAGGLNPVHRIGSQVAEPLTLHLDLNRSERDDRVIRILEAVGIDDPAEAVHRYPHEFSGGQKQRIALAAAMVCEPEVLILDEPTTGLDVTTQEQISELIAGLVARTGTAALQISHDLVLLSATCNELMIMYAGEVMESGSAADIYAEPRHPYSAALLDSVPRIDDPVQVTGIPGLPPPRVVEGACAFAPRCAFVQPLCEEAKPALAPIKGRSRQVRCARAKDLGPITSGRPEGSVSSANGKRAQRLLAVDELDCTYPAIGRRAQLEAVKRVSIDLRRGENLAIVGESGSGKSTLLRAIAGLHSPDSGSIDFEGSPLPARAIDRPRELRKDIQLVFQDPHASLNPRHTIRAILDRPLRLFRPDLGRVERRARIQELLAEVRLDRGVIDRLPGELSGGQKQRVALARAFAAEPKLLLCDEVVSALDVSVQASLLELLESLVEQSSVAVLFVTHDLAIVRQIASRVYVMRNGEICEEGPTASVFEAPEHPYTRELMAAVPRPARA